MNLLKEKKIIKNMLVIIGGSFFAQGLSILLSPIVTRLYTPEDYGILTVYIAILGMINLLGSLSYESAIPIANDDEKAFDLLVLCLGILLILSSILFLILLILTEKDFTFFKIEKILKYKYYLPIGFFLTGIYSIISQWALRQKDFKSLATTKYSQSIVGNFIKISFGILNLGAIGLVFGTILSQSAGIITLFKPNIKKFKKLIKEVRIKKIKEIIIRYKKFPLYNMPGLLILSISSQIPVIYISSLYGSKIVGFYGLARSITFLPMTIIGKSIQDVFYGEIASIGKKNPKKIKELSGSFLKKLILIGIFPVLVLVLLGPLLFSFVFGKEWELAGNFSRIIGIEGFFHFIIHPISSILSIFEEQKKALIINIIRIILVLFSFQAAKYYNFKIEDTILLYSLSMVIIEILKYVVVQNIINARISKEEI